jgi:hypothetical protein
MELICTCKVSAVAEDMRICIIEPSHHLSVLILKLGTPTKLLALALVGLFFVTLAMTTVPVFAASSAPQFASYSISGTGSGGRSFSAIVNETVSPSSAAGMSDVTFAITSAHGNLTYSKIINSTQVILPYFPTIANQSLTYQIHNFTISATINQAGTASASFNGKSVSVSNYTFNLNVSGNRTVSATGSASVFPSGLVYSATLVANGSDTINVQLLSTNLSLTSQSDPPSQATTSIAIAGGAASVLVGIGAIVVYKRRTGSQAAGSQEKPLYHVD